MIVHYKNYIYDIEEIPNLSFNINTERSYKIIEFLNNNMHLENAILHSNYFIYNKYFGCIYNKNIMNTI